MWEHESTAMRQQHYTAYSHILQCADGGEYNEWHCYHHQCLCLAIADWQDRIGSCNAFYKSKNLIVLHFNLCKSTSLSAHCFGLHCECPLVSTWKRFEGICLQLWDKDSLLTVLLDYIWVTVSHVANSGSWSVSVAWSNNHFYFLHSTVHNNM